MAKIKKGILGPISGTLGPVIGAEWMGVAYLRMKRRKEINSERTVAQLNNQAKFKYVNDWLIPFHPYFSVGMLYAGTYKTPVGNALKANYKTVFSGKWPDIEVDCSKLVISKGDLAPLGNPVIVWDGPDSLQLTWQRNEVGGAAFNDQLILALYNEGQHLVDGFVGGAVRVAQGCRFSPQVSMKGQPMHVYVGVVSLDRSKISHSQYLGVLNPFQP
ncbi:DUF6266 family protein [Pedobacter sp. JY14-1]|uniref:DUF6266 family protein n=1 Tax=Pedobacter sp. JY14-1 TaxID=3034151 RepID=UPI0023E0BF2B|nr:DUF6266 family protein [Pedobacter sp. JY14-1]